MIRQVVFDFSGVLFEWNPKQFVESFTQDPKEQEKLMIHVLKHQDWTSLNLGTALMAEVLPKFAARTDIPEYKMQTFIEHLQHSMQPMHKTLLLLNEFKAHYGLYFISNISEAFFDTLNEKYNVNALFNGGIISGKERTIKPEPLIYETLLERYQLTASECLFIDHTLEHVHAARNLGFQVQHFQNNESCYRGIRQQLLANVKLLS